MEEMMSNPAHASAPVNNGDVSGCGFLYFIIFVGNKFEFK